MQSVRHCSQCAAMIGPPNRQRRCTRRTCKYGPYCWQHTRIFKGLEVANAQFGLGLFRRVYPRQMNTLGQEIQAGDTIIENIGTAEIHGQQHQFGEFLTQQELDTRYPGNTLAEYVIGEAPPYLDLSRTDSSVVRYLNDCNDRNVSRANRRECNTGVIWDPTIHGYNLVANENIPLQNDQGQPTELTYNYGPDYWT